MRKPRMLGDREKNYYHVMSRVVNREFVLGDTEKEFFRLTMRRLEAFTGVRVLTYCVMSNHWHILAEVPEVNRLDDEMLLKRIRDFYPKSRAADIIQEYERAKTYASETGLTDWLDAWREKYLSRMGNLSSFVKELKERYSKWHNRRHGRRGTLWEERFKSVLIENSDHAITTMATYIDLNPVRAGLVDDPRDYRYGGYAEAVAGGALAREGLGVILRMAGQDSSWRKVSARYRMQLFSVGEESESRKGFEPERIQQVIDEGGLLSSHELMRCRIRYFSDGAALGSRRFVEEVFERNRALFGERRKNGARKLRGGDWDGLCTLRDLKTNAIRAPG